MEPFILSVITVKLIDCYSLNTTIYVSEDPVGRQTFYEQVFVRL